VGRAQEARSLACLDPASGVTWTSLARPEERATLDRWCDSVGPPVIVRASGSPRPITRLVVATWNVHVGGGHLERLLEWIHGQPDLDRQPYGLVLLLEEAFRAGPAINATYPAGLKVPSAIRPRRPSPDISELAAIHAMHAAYVPSMRNGPGATLDTREDRGNAILSTEPLADVRAIELPFGKQRRVAVAATIAPAGTAPVRVVAMHLDTSRGDRTRQAAAIGGYLPGLAGGVPAVAAGDLNTLFGRRERAFKVLNLSLPVEDCGTRRTNVWPWRLDIPFGWWRGRIDFVFDSLTAFDASRRCGTVANRFGSDHHPVVMVIALPVTAPAPARTE